MTITRTHFTFSVDTSTPDGAGVEDYQVALATYPAACERWPDGRAAEQRDDSQS